MDLIERYLAAIAGHLPTDKADDIVAELRDVLLRHSGHRAGDDLRSGARSLAPRPPTTRSQR